MVLVKHSFAGKQVDLSDVKTLFGKNVVEYMGKQNVSQFLAWTRANKRSEIKFRLPSHTYTDAGERAVINFNN